MSRGLGDVYKRQTYQRTMWRFWTSDKGAEADSDGLAVWESADDTDFAIHSGDCAPRPHQAKCNSLTNNKLYISFE